MNVNAYLSNVLMKYQGSREEKTMADILFNNNVDIQLGDQRLNNIAALTYNSTQCDKIFGLLEKALDPQEYPWKTLYKALLMLNTILQYGSEKAVDSAIQLCRFIVCLQQYNSALIKKSFGSGGMDYGAPVREQANILVPILMDDNAIRDYRRQARSSHDDTLVPLGEFVQTQPQDQVKLHFGQVVDKSVGAGHTLEQVPGMYDGRPDRYFDDFNDRRRAPVTTGDHQFTREAMNPNSLLDLAFDSPVDGGGFNTSNNLPDPTYLPAIQRQKELEMQLAAQQEQLRRLQELAAVQQLQQQHLQQQQLLGLVSQPTTGYPPANTQSNYLPPPPPVPVDQFNHSSQPLYPGNMQNNLLNGLNPAGNPPQQQVNNLVLNPQYQFPNNPINQAPGNQMMPMPTGIPPYNAPLAAAPMMNASYSIPQQGQGYSQQPGMMYNNPAASMMPMNMNMQQQPLLNQQQLPGFGMQPPSYPPAHLQQHQQQQQYNPSQQPYNYNANNSLL